MHDIVELRRLTEGHIQDYLASPRKIENLRLMAQRIAVTAGSYEFARGFSEAVVQERTTRGLRK